MAQPRTRWSQEQRNEGYPITQNEAEVERLVTFAHAWDPHVRDGMARIGMERGGKAIDVGCGPLGALLTFAEIVGPEGVVEAGLATDEEVDRAYRELEDAETWEFQATFSTLSVELIAQVP